MLSFGILVIPPLGIIWPLPSAVPLQTADALQLMMLTAFSLGHTCFHMKEEVPL